MSKNFKTRGPLPYSLSVTEAAKYIGIGRNKMLQLIDEGVIKAYEPLKPIMLRGAKKSKRVIRRTDLEKLIDENMIPTTEVASFHVAQ